MSGPAPATVEIPVAILQRAGALLGHLADSEGEDYLVNGDYPGEFARALCAAARGEVVDWRSLDHDHPRWAAGPTRGPAGPSS